MDVADVDSVKQAVKRVASMYDRLDIGVNAAGVAGGRPEDENPLTIWRHVIDVDLNGVYYCCLEYASIMKGQKYGKIINIASMSATIVNNFPQPPVEESRLLGLPAYCAAKAGVKQLTKVLAAQWAKYDIYVNCISPGYMHTEMTKEIFEMPEVIKNIEEETPLRRVGKPEDLDGLILYLVSDASDFMTGSDLVIDGGYTIW
jgi:NAD(P)-dependent dehydrogenase (short-subunit alcohol dehydrogenase family)